LSLFFLLAATGCLGSKQCGISGYVLTRPHIYESYILTSAPDELELTHVAEARIFLALDKEGHEIVKGCETNSDATGKYHLDTKDLPPAKDSSGCYYLFVQKEGYQEFTHWITIGPLAPFRENRVILKPLQQP
jgi:hypothetical protein